MSWERAEGDGRAVGDIVEYIAFNHAGFWRLRQLKKISSPVQACSLGLERLTNDPWIVD